VFPGERSGLRPQVVPRYALPGWKEGVNWVYQAVGSKWIGTENIVELIDRLQGGNKKIAYGEQVSTESVILKIVRAAALPLCFLRA